MKKYLAIGAICLALIMNLQYALSHLIVKTAPMGVPAMAATVDDSSSDSNSDSAEKPKYYAPSDAACNITCYHYTNLQHTTWVEYPATGTETDCVLTTDKTSTCKEVACDAKCNDGD
jgi:hypothetical protein